MPSVVSGFEYDIFVSYRHNDNLDGWVTDFVQNLEKELKGTLKDSLTIYFDKNPHDGLLETHQVDKSLERKLSCLIFIPILSQTYCDPKSFAWQHEFCAFNRLAKEDQFGREMKVSNGNVASRILPVKIHDLDNEDRIVIENELGGPVRAVEFIFKSPGVNRPLLAHEEHYQDNQGKTFYRDQINKVANAIKEIVQATKSPSISSHKQEEKPTQVRKTRKSLIVVAILVLCAAGYFFVPAWVSSRIESDLMDRSVAVLPFVNMSNDQEQEYFSDGITEQIITNLAHINSLKVIARTSVMKFKKTNKSIAEIGRELNVTHVLEGSIRRSEDRIRVTAQLIAVKDEAHVWAQDYDRHFSDIFTVQDEVSMAIASSLQRRLTPKEYENMKSERTSNVEAYQRYLKASHLHNEVFYIKLLKEDFIKAENEFKAVIQLDPGYGLAYAGAADLYDTYRNFVAKGREERLKFEAIRDSCSAMAMRLSPNNPYVISVRAYSFSGKTDRTDADTDSVFKYRRKALAIAPNDARICDAISIDYGSQGLYFQALQYREQAISLDPTFGTYHALLGAIYLQQGDFEKAEAAIKKGLLMEPDDITGLRQWTDLKFTTGDLAEAERTIQKIKSINQQGSRGWYDIYPSAMKSARKGEKDKALGQLKHWSIYLALGMKKEAMDELEKNPRLNYLNLKSSPVYDPLRQDPRFAKMLENARLVYEEKLKKYAN